MVTISQRSNATGLYSNLAVFGSGLLLTCCMALIAWQGVLPVSTLDNLIQDTFVRIAGEHLPLMDKTVVVDIDEESLVTVGQWPWPRYHIAALLTALTAQNARAVGVDILFSEPDRTSLDTIQQAFSREFGLDIGFTGVPSGLEDNDAYLGHVFSRVQAVGATYMYFSLVNREAACIPPPLDIRGDVTALSPPQASGMLCNTPQIQRRLTQYGFINSKFDDDGILRNAQLLIAHNGGWYPNLTLAMLMKYAGVTSLAVTTDMFGPVLLVGELRIPVTASGQAALAFPSRLRAPVRLSALQVLAKEAAPEDIAGKIVYIGSSAAGLNDLHHTPVSSEFPGVAAHAVLSENVLSGVTYRRPVWGNVYAGVTTLLTGLVLSLLAVSFSPGRAAAGAVLMTVFFPVAGAVAFFAWGVLVSVSGPLLIALLLFGWLSQLLYYRERKKAFLQLQQLAQTRQTTIEAMAAVAETRDPETGAHIKRTQHYVRALALSLARSGKYPELTGEYIDLLFHSAPLHDIGKVGVPDYILRKPGPLLVHEFEEMKKHTLYGKEIVDSARRGQGEVEFFDTISEIAYTHHEKWDGSGYPEGLSGEDIPLSGRLMALADVYDALISKRHYKEAFSHEKARGIILEGRGTHFDPAIVDCFFTIEEQFIHIAAVFKDGDIDYTAKAFDEV